ncbi:MAG: CHASE2 domain-containing protein [Kiritimatiellaeota bacterium]|nr:CHASE2 domain-containing protein [Kiritimatiellota bacterium]
MRSVENWWHHGRWPLLTAGVVLTLYLAGVFEPLELLTHDARFLFRGYRLEPSPVTIVGITQQCIREIGPLPWPRTVYAKAIRKLKAAGARVICFDVFFPVRSEPAADRELVRAVREAGNVILPVFCPSTLRRNAVGKGAVRRVPALTRSFPELSTAAVDLAHINVPPAVDGRCRAVPFAIEYGGRIYYALGIEAARRFLAGSTTEPSRAASVVDRLPLTRDGELMINYYGQQAAFEVRTMFELLEGNVPSDAFKDKIVLIGQTALGQVNTDVLATPLGQMFGVLVQGTIMDNIVTGKVLRRQKVATFTAMLFAFSFLSISAFKRLSPLLAGTLGLVVIAGWIAVAFFIFFRFSYMVELVPPVGLFAANLGIVLALGIAESRAAVRQKNVELAAVMNSSRLSAADLAADESPQVLVDLIGRTIGCDAVSLTLVQQGGVWYWFPNEPGGRFTQDDTPALRAFEERHNPKFLESSSVLLVPGDLREDPRFSTGAVPTESFLSVPMIVRNETIGVLNFYNKRPSDVSPTDWFTDEDLRLIGMLAQQAALLLDNLRLVADLAEKNRQLERAMRDLKAAQGELVRSEKLSAVGQMAAMIVHDIRNALSAVMGYVELVRANAGQVAGNEDWAALVQSRIEQISSMAQEVLEYSRNESHLDLSDVDVSMLVQDVLAVLRDAYPGTEIRWASQIACSATVRADRDKMIRVLMNLGRNAAEAMGQRGVFTLGCRPLAGGVELVASDTGPGIPEDIQETLFEPFVTQGKSSGTGLGLAIAKRTIEEHGGRITFETGSGGTTFYIRLPLAPDEERY